MFVPPIGEPSKSTIQGAIKIRPDVRPRLVAPGWALQPIKPTKDNTVPTSNASVKRSKSSLMNSNRKWVATSMYPAKMPTAIKAAPDREIVLQMANERDREGMEEFYRHVALLPGAALKRVI